MPTKYGTMAKALPLGAVSCANACSAITNVIVPTRALPQSSSCSLLDMILTSPETRYGTPMQTTPPNNMKRIATTQAKTLLMQGRQDMKEIASTAAGDIRFWNAKILLGT